MKVDARIIAKIGLGVLVVSLFVGCKPLFDLFKKKPEQKVTQPIKGAKEEVDASVVLLKINGEPAITENKFKKHLAQMMQMNPYFRGASADSLPAPLQRKFFDELVKQEVILAWSYKNNMDQDSEFLKSLDEMIKLVKRSLLVQSFEKKIFDDIKVDSSEMKKYYETNKERFVKEQGGVLVSAIKFSDQAKADAFFNKVKGKNAADFAKLAKKENSGEFEDFGRVSDGIPSQGGFMMPQPPAAIKKKIASIKSFPALEKVKSGKDIWVAYFSDKKDKEFFQFKEVVAQQIEPMLKHNKFRDIINERVDKIKSDFSLDINEDRFKQTEQPAAPKVGKVVAKNENVAAKRVARAQQKTTAGSTTA